MWWLILLILPALVVLLLFLKVRLCICYEDDLTVKIKILLFNISLFPQKTKKLKPKDYSIKNLRKKQKKLNKRSKKTQQKQPQQEAQTASKKDKATQINEILEIVKIIIENVMSPFGRYLKIEIIKMYVKIGTNDPAKTAVLYGVVSQTVSYIVELLSNITNVDVKKKNSITVFPDFLEERSEAKINITLGLRVWHSLVLAVKFFMKYIKRKKTNISGK